MDYNTQREKLILPEYGRNVQKMIEQVKAIENKEKRSEQMRSIQSSVLLNADSTFSSLSSPLNSFSF